MPKAKQKLESREKNVFLIHAYEEELANITETIERFFLSYEGEPGTLWNVQSAKFTPSSRDLLQMITSLTKECDLAIVILASLKSNVAFEFGMIHALEKDCILLVPEGDINEVKKMFSDICGLKFTPYNPNNIYGLSSILQTELERLAKDKRKRIIKKVTPEYLVAIGDAFLSQGLYSEAMLRYKAAIDAKDDFYEAWIRLGESQLQILDLSGAEKSFRKALDLRPKDVVAHEKLGQALLDSGQYKKAIAQCFKPLIDLRPKVTTYYYKAAESFCLLDTPDKAVGFLEKSIKKLGDAPERAAPCYDCAWCCIWQSKRVKSTRESEQWIRRGLKALKESIAINPKYAKQAKHDQDFDSVRNRDDFPC